MTAAESIYREHRLQQAATTRHSFGTYMLSPSSGSKPKQPCLPILLSLSSAARNIRNTNPSVMAPLKVLISGGGIAGNALAFWLSKLGHDITVVERFPSLRTTGLQIDLRGPGIEVLKRMGLEQAFRSNAAREDGIQVVDKTGRRRAYFPANKSGKGPQAFTSEFEIMRGDLCRIIYDAAKVREVSYIFATSIERFENTGDGVEVWFSNGKTERFDLLVGADGQGSHTRKMMPVSYTHLTLPTKRIV